MVCPPALPSAGLVFRWFQGNGWSCHLGEMGLPGPLFPLQMHKIFYFPDLPLGALIQIAIKWMHKFPSTVSSHSPHLRAVPLSPGKFGFEFHTLIFCSHPLGTPSSIPATKGTLRNRLLLPTPLWPNHRVFFLNICSGNHNPTGVASSLALIPNPWGKSLPHPQL